MSVAASTFSGTTTVAGIGKENCHNLDACYCPCYDQACKYGRFVRAWRGLDSAIVVKIHNSNDRIAQPDHVDVDTYNSALDYVEINLDDPVYETKYSPSYTADKVMRAKKTFYSRELALELGISRSSAQRQINIFGGASCFDAQLHGIAAFEHPRGLLLIEESSEQSVESNLAP